MAKPRLGHGLRMKTLVEHARNEPPAVKVANALMRFARAKSRTLGKSPVTGGSDGEASR